MSDFTSNKNIPSRYDILSRGSFENIKMNENIKNARVDQIKKDLEEEPLFLRLGRSTAKLVTPYSIESIENGNDVGYGSIARDMLSVPLSASPFFKLSKYSQFVPKAIGTLSDITQQLSNDGEISPFRTALGLIPNKASNKKRNYLIDEANTANGIQNKNIIENEKGYVDWDKYEDVGIDRNGDEYLEDAYIKIDNLFIDPKYRNSGEARKLMEQAISRIKKEHPGVPIKIVPEPKDKLTDKSRLSDFYESLGLDVVSY